MVSRRELFGGAWKCIAVGMSGQGVVGAWTGGITPGGSTQGNTSALPQRSVRLSPGSYRYLHIADERFSLHTTSIELFEDLHTPLGMWRRPLREWRGWSDDGKGGWNYHCEVPTGPEGAWQLDVWTRPGEGEVSIQATLKNAGTRAWKHVVGEACLNARSFLWLDAEGERILIFTRNGPLRLNDADYISRPARRRYLYHTFAENRKVGERGWEFVWGPSKFGANGLTLEPITEGLIVAHEGNFENKQVFIGLAWDRVAYLWTNFSNCIHCSPMFGDLAPGEESTRQGKVYVSEDLDSLLMRYRMDFPTRGRIIFPGASAK